MTRIARLSVVVADLDASMAFYEELGFRFPCHPKEVPAGSGARHAESMGDEATALALDTHEMAQRWNPAFDPDRQRGQLVIELRLDRHDAVDELVARTEASGHTVTLQPHDAYWGARYAIVEDPDGNLVGLMGPAEPGHAASGLSSSSAADSGPPARDDSSPVPRYADSPGASLDSPGEPVEPNEPG